MIDDELVALKQENTKLKEELEILKYFLCFECKKINIDKYREHYLLCKKARGNYKEGKAEIGSKISQEKIQKPKEGDDEDDKQENKEPQIKRKKSVDDTEISSFVPMGDDAFKRRTSLPISDLKPLAKTTDSSIVRFINRIKRRQTEESLPAVPPPNYNSRAFQSTNDIRSLPELLPLGRRKSVVGNVISSSVSTPEMSPRLAATTRRSSEMEQETDDLSDNEFEGSDSGYAPDDVVSSSQNIQKEIYNLLEDSTESLPSPAGKDRILYYLEQEKLLKQFLIQNDADLDLIHSVTEISVYLKNSLASKSAETLKVDKKSSVEKPKKRSPRKKDKKRRSKNDKGEKGDKHDKHESKKDKSPPKLTTNTSKFNEIDIQMKEIIQIRVDNKFKFISSNTTPFTVTKHLKRSSSFNRISLRDINQLTLLSKEEEGSLPRYLTFIVYLATGTKVLQLGYILDILHWIITSHESTTQDMEVFLFTFRQFSSPTLIFETFIQIFSIENNVYKQKVSEFLQLWIKYYYTIDFHNDSRLCNKFWKFISSKFTKVSDLRSLAASWENQHWELVKEFEPSSLYPMAFHPVKINILNEDPMVLAQQLTIIEWELFEYFNVFDFICEEKPTSRLIDELVKRFNSVSDWVATQILLEAKPRKRAAVIAFFISVARALFEIKNFNGVIEITSALDSISISRLKKTWKIVTTTLPKSYDLLKQLRIVMSHENNFLQYRKLVKGITPPCLPFYGIISKDVTMINVGNVTTEKNLVNFEKSVLIWKVACEIMTFQRTPFTFPTKPLLKSYLANLQVKTDNELYDLSIKYEPLNNNNQQI